MQQNTDIYERLASLEAKLTFLKELLTEIRDDVKDQPSKSDYINLEERLTTVEKNYVILNDKYNNMLVKLGISSAILSMLGAGLIKYLLG